MSVPAFYLPPAAWSGSPCLTAGEAHHVNVLRLKEGSEVLVMDGLGRSAVCVLGPVGRGRVELQFVREWRERAPECRCVVALALSKAVRRGFFLEKAAELGAWEIWLWRAARSQGRLDAALAESCEAQLRAGAKQCHNPWFPRMRLLGDASALGAAAQEARWRILPWEAKAGQTVIAESELARPGTTVFAIGPEGGLTEGEVGLLAEAGFVPASIGSRVLRCETAATLCLGLHWWASQLNAANER